jgi:hypothetical protein
MLRRSWERRVCSLDTDKHRPLQNPETLPVGTKVYDSIGPVTCLASISSEVLLVFLAVDSNEAVRS